MNLNAFVARALPNRMGKESPFVQFWNWWSSELLYFVPPRLRELFDKKERSLLVSVRESELLVEYRHGIEREQCDPISLVDKPESGPEAKQSGSRDVYPESDTAIVELSPLQAARRQVTLPFGTEDRIADVLGFEMDRFTPFASKDVYFDYRVAGRDPGRRVMIIDLVVALRKTVDDILDRLVRRGINASRVTLAGANDPADRGQAVVDLLPKARRVSTASRLPRVPAALTALAVVLAIVAVAYPLVQQRIALSSLGDEISRLSPGAAAADQVRSEIAETARQSGFFADKWASTPTKIHLLDEISKVVPDGTWLTRIQINGTTVRIHGESEGASSLIGLIEESDLLRDARFSSPVTKNPRTANDRFVIEMQIELENNAS